LIPENDLKPISPSAAPAVYASAEHVSSGIPIPKPLRVAIFSAEEWESFTEEWASSLENTYKRVARFAGAGDLGLDVVGFVSDDGWDGDWDNYQCKRYDHSLHPGDIWIEIGKIIYYSFKGEYSVPRKYYFIASQDVGTTLQKLLAKPDRLKAQARENWDKHCKSQITSTVVIPLAGELLTWVDNFDFSIFTSKSVVSLIAEHAQTPFHSVRFGGGLPPRPDVTAPPEEHAAGESRYLQQLFNAYGHHLGSSIREVADLSACAEPMLKQDYLRQRERFYHAESLRNFARDTVPEGTFEKLQDEVFHGVIETCDKVHADGLERMRETLSRAAAISTAANPLKSVTQVQDQQGICHQLANEDRLIWVPEGEEVRDDSTV
jgi:hypothetical protein